MFYYNVCNLNDGILIKYLNCYVVLSANTCNSRVITFLVSFLKQCLKRIPTKGRMTMPKNYNYSSEFSYCYSIVVRGMF